MAWELDIKNILPENMIKKQNKPQHFHFFLFSDVSHFFQPGKNDFNTNKQKFVKRGP
jgi:hypothetical protein